MKSYLIDMRALGDYAFKVLEMIIDRMKEGEMLILFSYKDPSKVLRKMGIRQKVDIVVKRKASGEWITYIIARSSRVQNY
ncbi:hypothetical protein [Acidianus sp. HS-5]|uniref:hypothetical protein n=1 Tax=Acidianus sp. HS-5 TaxID=2886040 RepID=UPI001F3C729A|nr:hypothetical protein [Acidianus sp. HS-5]BDC17588.1 hypothetical protein HS5_04780 [Acidianus sp. HS-5]